MDENYGNLVILKDIYAGDTAVEAAQNAKNFIRQFESLEDLDIMAHAKGGESRRAHDFIRVDLPLMIDVAEGRDPSQRENLSQRQKALLEMSPGDAANHVNSNMETARRVLGWNAPFAKDETKEFILRQETFTHELRNGFFAQRENQQEADLSAAYTNSPESPLPDDMFEAARKQEATMGYYRPGDMTIIPPRDREPDEDPFSFPERKIEEVQLSRVSEESASYYSAYRLEGEAEFHKRSELLDPRGTQHTYGVIQETAGRLYYVETESPFSKHEPENMVAREIIGVEKTMIDRIARDIETAQNDVSNSSLDELVPVAKDSEFGVPKDIRESLALEKGEAIAGEFVFHPVDGPNDRAGPIIIEASSWQSQAGPEEKIWADQAVRRHMEKYEFPKLSISDQNDKDRVSMKSFGEPKVETVRHSQNQALAAAAMGQGM